MAPESERAQRKYGDCLFCGFPKYQHIGGETCPPKETEYMTKPNEPTLTCSEVVERLPAKEFLKLKRDQWTDLTGYKFAGRPTIDDQACQFAEAYATAILHSWRERRVQELEDCLREIYAESVGKDTWFKRMAKIEELAENILANSEWREQTRKGAKHE